jgi:hypothetical protein
MAELILDVVEARVVNEDGSGWNRVPVTTAVDMPDGLHLTPRQIGALRYVCNYLLNHHWGNEYEWKQLSIDATYGTPWLTAECGRVDDEGTLGWWYRPHLHIAIGPRGGISTYKGTSKRTGQDALRTAYRV